MRSVHRFFAPSLDPGDETVTLPRDEAEHLTRVLRLGVGDTVPKIARRAREIAARIVRADRRDARVQIVSRVSPAAREAVQHTPGQEQIKGEKMDDIVRDA